MTTLRKGMVAFAAIAAITIGAVSTHAQDQNAAKAFADAHQKMQQSMMMKPTGDADKDFAMMMIPHHQGAIDMAQIELKYGKDPTLRAMAEKIIKDQQAEIAEFQKWSKAHGGM